MTTTLPVRVLVVDPYPITVEGLLHHIATTDDLALVASARSARAVRPLLRATPFDVLLVDAPKLGGVALLHELVAAHPRAVVLYTDLMNFTADLMAVGARGSVSKREAAAVVLEALRTVGRGGWYRSPEAEACWRWYAEHGRYGLTPAQLRSWRRDHGLPVDEDG